MPIVNYRGKNITFPDDISESEINDAMGSIADQIDADLQLESKQNNKGIFGKLKDDVVEAFTPEKSLLEKGLLKQKQVDENAMSRKVKGVPFRADYIDSLQQQDRISPKSIDAQSEKNGALGRAADEIINERAFNKEINRGTNEALNPVERKLTFDERMKEKRRLNSEAKAKIFTDTLNSASQTGDKENALKQALNKVPSQNELNDEARRIAYDKANYLEPSIQNIIHGLAETTPQSIETLKQGLLSQYADLTNNKYMAQEASVNARLNRDAIEKTTPDFESETAQGLYSGATSLIQQVPGLAASIVTGNPVPALTAAGLFTEAEAYTRYKERGATPQEALTGAMGEGAVEVMTEVVPMKFLVDKFGKVGAGKFIAGFIARDALPEQVATITQDAIDTAIANPDKTWGEYLAERPSAAYQTLLATVVQAGAMGSANKVAQKFSEPSIVDQLKEQKQQADNAIQSITNPDISIDDAIELAKTATSTPLVSELVSDETLLNEINQYTETPIEALPATDILESDNVSVPNDTAELATNANAIGADNGLGSEGNIPSESDLGGISDTTATPTPSIGSDLAVPDASASADAVIEPLGNSEQLNEQVGNADTVTKKETVLPNSWRNEFERAKTENDLPALNSLYDKVRVSLNGIAQSKGEQAVKEFESLKADIENHAKELNATKVNAETQPVSEITDNAMSDKLTITEPKVDNKLPTQAPKVSKSIKSPSTLLGTLKGLGGVTMGDKLDVTGQDKAFAPGGYNQVFTNKSKQSLKGHIENGDLDAYLPYDMRTSNITKDSDAYDSTPAYDYLAERIRNGERVLPYEAVEEIQQSKFYANDDVQTDIQSGSELFNDDEINAFLREAGYDERENISEAQDFEQAKPDSVTVSNEGSETRKTGSETQAPNEVAGTNRSNAKSQERQEVRPLVEAIVKRRAAATQIGKEKQFDTYLALAKKMMNGEQVKSTNFKLAANAFKADPKLAETFNKLHELTKAPAKEARAEKLNTVETYKQIIANAKTVAELQAIARDIQDESVLSDKQATELDDMVMDKIDSLSQPEAEDVAEEATISKTETVAPEASNETEQQILARFKHIFLPDMTKGRLDKLLNKEQLNNDEIELLKDYKAFLIYEKETAANKGFYQELQTSGQKETAYVLKDKFLLSNIDNKLNKAANFTLTQETNEEILAREQAQKDADAEKAKADAKAKAEEDKRALEAQQRKNAAERPFEFGEDNKKVEQAVKSGSEDLFAQEDKPAQAIEDFGEKIGGAKKDLWASYQDKMESSLTEDIASVPLSKSWPEPDYQALIDNGADPMLVAFAHSMRDAVTTKPKSQWKVKGWASKVEALRDFSYSWIENKPDAIKIKNDIFSKASGFPELREVYDRADLYQKVGHEKSLKGIRVSSGQYSIYNGVEHKPAKVIWTVEKDAAATAYSNWPKQFATGDTKEEAINNFVKAFKNLEITPPANKQISFDIYSYRHKLQGKFIVGKKVGKSYIDLKVFDTVKEAREYKTNNQAELEAMLAKAKEIPNERNNENNPRVGIDHRNGANITPQIFGETFGFRGVEFGNYVENDKRQKDLNEAYDALMDMAGVLNIPPKAISLNGELGIAFGARGSGGKNPAKAHYERDFVVINMTKNSGAGSLGHEWWHALDNYFSRMRNKRDDYTTEADDVALAAKGVTYRAQGEVRKEMLDAFGSIMKAINTSSLKERSKQLDKTRTKDYWTTVREMTARSFESYLIAKLQDQNASNDYLANIVSEETWGREDSYPYPTAGEIAVIREAYDNFFNTVQTKETEDGNVVMFSRSGAVSQTDTEEFKKWFGDSKVVDADGKPLVVYRGDITPINEFKGTAFFGSQSVANDFADPEYMFGDKTLNEGEAPTVTPVYLNITNPKIFTTEDEYNDYVMDGGEFSGADWQAQGFDGVIYAPNGNIQDKSAYYMVYSPNQIKSAIGNNGNFDPNNPDIRYSRDSQSISTGITLDEFNKVLEQDFGKNTAKKLIDKGIVKPLQNQTELPSHVVPYLRDGDIVFGFYDPKTDSTYAVLENLTPEMVKGLILHEVGTHYGFKRMLGKEKYDSVIKQMQGLRKLGFKKVVNAYNSAIENAVNDKQVEEEAIAYLVQNHPEMGFIQKLISNIKAFLFKEFGIGKLTEADIATLAQSAVYRSVREQVYKGERGLLETLNAAFGRNNRTPSKEQGDTHLTAFIEALAQNEDLFQYQTISDKSINKIAKAIDVGYELTPLGASQTKLKKATKAWDVKVPNSTYRSGTIYENGNEVWIDVSRLVSGNDRGSAIYAIAADYAHNNGKVLIGDPEGLSRKAVYRRNENMLSSALKHGTTKHLMPHIAQEVPSEYYQGAEAEFGKNVRALNWIVGDDVNNIKEMLYNSHDSAIKNAPEIKDVTYNPESRQFEYADGRPFTDKDSEEISARIANEPDNPYRAGSSTLKRAALINTFLRKESAGRRGELLGKAVTELQRNGLNPAFKGVMYSRNQSIQDSDISFSRNSNQDIPPEETTAQAIQRIGQDKFNRFKVIQDWVKSQGVSLSEGADVYQAETLMSGRVASRKEDFRESQVEPLIQKTQKAGITMEQIGDFLKAQHAPEANKRARTLQGRQDATAYGVSDEDAKETMDEFKSLPNYAELKTIANEWRSITDQTKKIKLDSGLLSDEMVKAWEDTYEVYVPVKGNDEDSKIGLGKGLNVNGKTKQRLGHGLRDEAIIENILRDHEAAISLDEKNRVGKSLIKFALEVKNDDIVTIGKPEKRKVLKQGESAYVVQNKGMDEATFDTKREAEMYIQAQSITGKTKSNYAIEMTTDPVRVMLQASPQLADNEVNVYVKGHAIRLQINDDIAAREYKNMGVEHLNTVLSASREVNNWLSKAYTGYSPDFIFTNPLRDAVQGAITLTGNYGAGMSAKIFTNYPNAVKELIKHFKNKGSSELVTEYRQQGGSTGGAYLSDLDRIGNDIQNSYNEYQGALTTYKNIYEKAIGEGKKPKTAHTLATLKAGAVGFKKIPIIGHFLRLMERLNSVTENALRVATYQTLRDSGLSKGQAAAQAKNLMNFNRKGEQSNAAGALYLFFNPSIQGTKLIQEALTTSPYKNQAQALAGSMTLFAFTMAMMALNGDDEDKDKWNKTPDHVKDGNLVINLPNGKQITITLPYGYRVFWSLGNVMADATQKGADFSKLGIRMASNIFENFSPIGNPMQGENGLFQLAPTTFKMALAPGVNEDSFGRPITPTKWNESTPDSQLMNRGTRGSLYDGVSEKLNSITGGSKYEAGLVDVSPETLKFWVKSVTGGAGQFAFDSINIAKAGAQGVAPQDVKDIPVVRKFIRESGVRDSRQAFWERKNEADLAAGEISLARKAHDKEALIDLRDRKGVLARMAKMSDRTLKMANARRDAIAKIQLDDSLTLSEKITRIKELEQEETKVYDKFISNFDTRVNQ